MKKIKTSVLLPVWVSILSLIGLGVQHVYANGIMVTNVNLHGQNVTNKTWQIQFDLNWNNSWRDGVNYDAAWIFVKYRISTGPWGHALINTSGYSTGTGTSTEIRVSPDNVGAFANRLSIGDGSYAVSGMELQWNYGLNSVLDSDLPQVAVMAIEMVYIPEGPFAIGDGNGSTESASALGGLDNYYYTVTTVLSPPLRADGNFTNGNGIVRIKGDAGIDNDGDGIIDNPDYPIGYKAFFIMKYNISQGQYGDFLNMLTSTQRTARFMNMNGNNRNTIQLINNNIFVQRPDRACNYISWTDGIAYTDWAGLRPFTETEFEKACRGPLPAVTGEYAWGNGSYSPSYANNSTINNSTRTFLSGTEDGTEITTLASNNVHWYGYNSGTGGFQTISGGDGNIGPARVGLNVDTLGTRINGGLSYYGVVDLSGNVTEQMYNITTTAGRQFTGTHGNGEIATNGTANVTGWPTSGFGFKGQGASNYNISNTSYAVTNLILSKRVSDRTSLQNAGMLSTRYDHAGFRCARTQWW